jgi:hypothetical protein
MKIAERNQKLGELFVKWNNREMTGDQAFYEVAKLFRPQVMKVWRESTNHKDTITEEKRK